MQDFKENWIMGRSRGNNWGLIEWKDRIKLERYVYINLPESGGNY